VKAKAEDEGESAKISGEESGGINMKMAANLFVTRALSVHAFTGQGA